MNDLDERLASLRTSAGAPSEAVVAADVARARTAAHARRRTRSAVAAGALSVALVGGGATLTLFPADQPPAPATALPVTADLVAYTGPQPDGFRIATVPEGFVVQGSNEYVLTLAPPGSDTDFTVFEDKVVIMLESAPAPTGKMSGDPVSVDGHPGAIRHTTGATVLEYDDGRHEVVVQAADSVGLTTEQLVELATGIEVTADVRPGDSGGTPGTEEKIVVNGKTVWRIAPARPEEEQKSQR